MAVVSSLAAIGTALGVAATASTATAATVGGLAVAGAAGALASGVTGIVNAANKPKSGGAPIYDAEAEKRKADAAASAQNKKRMLEQTQTVNTSALGNTGKVNTGKTVLGG